MRGLTRRWRLVHEPEDGTRPAPLIERILTARGLVDADSVRRFCTPKLTDLHDPSLIPNLDAAAERLVAAVRADETIAIYGDYDVDGITATAILYHLIRSAAPGARLTTYVPHRLDEGYGINADALRELRSRGVDVVVSVDCGITAVEPARVAREIGLTLIVTDHHAPPAEREALPDALLVHPRLPGSAYPFGDLCGAGVAFKLAWRFATCWCGSERVGEKLQRTLLDMLPLAALGTIADVVPLLGENRVIASHGLRLIGGTSLTGLRALIDASDLGGERIDSTAVGFRLGPRLNACGRMGHAAEAVRMLTDASADEAAHIAGRLAKLNEQRQATERRIADEAACRAEDAGMTGPDRRAIVLCDAGWHPGVIGIVCSRLVDRFGRPAVLLQRQDHTCRGSARSIEEYSIHRGLEACSEHLTRFGGHDAAAGLELLPERLERFTEALIEHANAHIEPKQLVPSIVIDCDAALDELDLAALREVDALSPFGRSNRHPTLRVRGVTLTEPPRPMGGQGRHLMLRFRQQGARGMRMMRGVWSREGPRAADLAAGMRVDLAIEPKVNEWNGRVSVEAEIRDIRVGTD